MPVTITLVTLMIALKCDLENYEWIMSTTPSNALGEIFSCSCVSDVLGFLEASIIKPLKFKRCI